MIPKILLIATFLSRKIKAQIRIGILIINIEYCAGNPVTIWIIEAKPVTPPGINFAGTRNMYVEIAKTNEARMMER
ncbi:hypothetical protein SDC9_188607 [bioreactor metagenome]|uniref:Uncharacterized protein n=1 Tax=bioreactor metagenome TaxID=1076179 RepID=A0A645HQ21_9ZZZZ